MKEVSAEEAAEELWRCHRRSRVTTASEPPAGSYACSLPARAAISEVPATPGGYCRGVVDYRVAEE
jgi:hypothetical protein